MIRLAQSLCLSIFLAINTLAVSATQGWSAAQAVYNTSPSALAGLSLDELNSFGLRLVTEAYEMRSRVERPIADEAKVNTTSDAVKAVIHLYDDDAVIQRARLNYGLTKNTYVPNYTGAFTISNIAVSQTSNTVLVISFDVQLPNRTSLESGNVYSGDSMPRLLVMRWNERDKMWKIFSHGDFDAPRTFLCGANKDFMPEKSTFKQEDIELALQLLYKLQTASLNGTEKSVQSPGFQYVFASGERKTAPGKIRARIKESQKALNVEAIKSDDLLVMRFDTISSLTLDGGKTEADLRPRLTTFHRDADGEWRMNAAAIFTVTAKLAENVKCVDP